jgi:hypothetical protein
MLTNLELLAQKRKALDKERREREFNRRCTIITERLPATISDISIATGLAYESVRYVLSRLGATKGEYGIWSLPRT